MITFLTNQSSNTLIDINKISKLINIGQEMTKLHAHILSLCIKLLTWIRGIEFDASQESLFYPLDNHKCS